MRKGIVALFAAVFLAGTVTAATVDLITDGAFDTIGGSLPDVGTSPWEALEADPFGVITETTYTRSASKAVRVPYYWPTDGIVQTLGAKVQAGEDYTIDMWTAAMDYSSKPNPLTFDVAILTSLDPGGPYTVAAERLGILSSAPLIGVYTNYTDVFTAAELSGVVGEYMQLRILKGAGTDHRLLIDDVAFYGPEAGEGTLQINPAEGLTISLYGASDTASGSLELSYIEGALGSNMVVSSISMVDASDPGFSVSPSSLVLTNPAPANESVLVEFDNVLGGIAPNGEASANVQVVWNDASTTVSATSTVPVLVNFPRALAYFDTTFTSPDFSIPDLSASWTGHTVPRTDTGCNDGTFGSLLLPAAEAVSLGAVAVNKDVPVATLTLVNNSADAMHLDEIHFDAGGFWDGAGAPKDFVLTTSGNITAVTLTNVAGIAPLGSKVGDASDYDLVLSNLVDNVLNPGEQAVFTWTFANWVDGAASIIDNVLVYGTSGEEVESSVTVAPDSLYMSFAAADGVVSNSFAVSYQGPTNVNVSAVSIINATSAGFSVDPTSFLMNDPAPSNTLVDVVFDNNVGNLLPSSSASADVQVVWNALGSASSSTSIVAVSVDYLGFAEENVIAAFHSTGAFRSLTDNAGVADIAINGIDTAVTGIEWGNNAAGSDDTSYGTLLGDAPTIGGAGQMNPGTGYEVIYIALTNNTQSEVVFDSLHFDFARKWGSDPTDSVTVELSGDLGSVTLTNYVGTISANNNLADFNDCDVDLTGLADRELADGESILLTFTYAGGDIGLVDNIALIGTGIAPAIMGRVGYGSAAKIGVTSLDLTGSQDIDLIYFEGDTETNVVVTGVSFANEDVPGSFSAVGPFPIVLPTPEITNSAVFSLVFDNGVANLPAGGSAYADVIVEFDEPGAGSRTYTFGAYGARPMDVPTNGILVLFDTDYQIPDAAVNGVMGVVTEGFGKEQSTNKGSEDGDYGSLASPAAPVNNDTLRLQGLDPVTTLTITNTSVGAIELSMLHFDIGQWYDLVGAHFTLEISGDVTPATLLDLDMNPIGWLNNDLDDHDVDLTGLADHVLGPYESMTLTWTVSVNPGSEEVGIWLDNIALMGTFDTYAGWASLNGAGAPNENHDGDSMINLAEFASGNDPWVADGPFAASWVEEDGGTTWFYSVHNERQDDPDLIYGVAGSASALSWMTTWDPSDVDTVGVSSGPGLWISVTNRTEATDPAKFISIGVERN
jgi:hypothetical protein